ncbi:hypothetical protein FRC05_008812 [Tulasnella sp. 425]|nr:hypothetical protein FRC05_008812 [Tulasnella sp. 425]
MHHIPSSSPPSRPWGFVSRTGTSPSTPRLSSRRESSVPPPSSRTRSQQQQQPQPVPFSGSYSSLAAGTSTSSLAGGPSSAAASTTSVTHLHLPPPRQQYFVEKRGKRHHAYGKKVPYTLSYERDVTDNHILDEEWNYECRNGITEWPVDNNLLSPFCLGIAYLGFIHTQDTQFIGFDLVPIQPNLDFLDPDVPPTVPSSASTFPPTPVPQLHQQHPISTSSSSSQQQQSPPPLPPLPPLPLQSATPPEPSRGRSASTNTQPSLVSVASSSKGSGASGSAGGGGGGKSKPRPSSLSLEALVAASVNASAGLAEGEGTKDGQEESDEEPVESPQPTLRLKERVRWVHGDFLEPLPFPDGYFDFVRARRIARGVPEHMWDHVYSELARVLKPGGTFEHFECNLTFPGGEFHTAFPGSPPKTDASQTSSGRRSFVGKLRRPRTSASAFEAATFGTVPPSPHRLRHQQSAPFASLSSAFTQHAEHATSKREGGLSVAPTMAKDPRDHSVLEAIYTSMHESKFINVTPISIIQNYLVLHFKDLRTHPPLTLFAPKRAVGDEHWPELKDGDYTPTTRMITAIELNAWAARAMGLKPTLPPSVQPQNLALQSRSFELARQQGPSSGSVSSSAASTATMSSAGTGGGSKTLESLVAAGPQNPAVPRLFKVEDFLGTDRSRSIPRVTMAPIPGLKGAIKSMNGLPNRTFQYDVGYSALQLSMNVAEVLGCAEEMWAYVKHEDPSAERGCFDDLLKRYAADMRNRIAMRELVEDRLGWEGRAKSDSPALKDFETQLQMALAAESVDGMTASTITGSTDGTAVGAPRPSGTFSRDPMGVEGVETSNSFVNGKLVARTFKCWCMVKAT